MELFVIGLALFFGIGIIIGTVGAIVALLTLWYAKSYYDKSETTGRRKWTLLRYAWFWKLLRSYVSLEYRDGETGEIIADKLWERFPLLTQSKYDGSSSYIFACHPHGLIPMAPLLTFGAPPEEHYPRRSIPNRSVSIPPRLHVHWLLFAIPILREICLWLGFLDASKNVIKKRLDDDESVVLIPAGSRGIIGDPGSETRHRGFLRIAYDRNVPVVPCWTPGETKIFKTWDLFPGLRRWAVRCTGYPFPTLFIGPLPFKKLTMYIGGIVDPRDCKSLEEFEDLYYNKLKALMART